MLLSRSQSSSHSPPLEELVVAGKDREALQDHFSFEVQGVINVLTDTLFNVDIIAPLTIPLTVDPGLICPRAGVAPALPPAEIDDLCCKGPGVLPIHSRPV